MPYITIFSKTNISLLGSMLKATSLSVILVLVCFLQIVLSEGVDRGYWTLERNEADVSDRIGYKYMTDLDRRRHKLDRSVVEGLDKQWDDSDRQWKRWGFKHKLDRSVADGLDKQWDDSDRIVWNDLDRY